MLPTYATQHEFSKTTKTRGMRNDSSCLRNMNVSVVGRFGCLFKTVRYKRMNE